MVKFKNTKLVNWCYYHWKQLRGTLTKTDIAVHCAIFNNQKVVELHTAQLKPSDYIGVVKRGVR